ncbi:hypothetical protein GCM10010182_67430 [Actinomadura cremea]|nr:hypothetical protein GCM10010182_67430 [Actinomadura cremea]
MTYRTAPAHIRAAARLAHAITRTAEAITDRLPHFPDPTAQCVAHANRYCLACHRGSPHRRRCNECGVYETTGMHWDTCNNRIR